MPNIDQLDRSSKFYIQNLDTVLKQRRIDKRDSGSNEQEKLVGSKRKIKITPLNSDDDFSGIRIIKAKKVRKAKKIRYIKKVNVSRSQLDQIYKEVSYDFEDGNKWL